RSSCNSASSTVSLSASYVGASHTSPKPRHCSHQPCGELNENKRGSSSSNDWPQPGQLISVLKIVKRFFASSSFAVPRPISSARTSSSSSFFPAPVSPTSTSIECSLKRSSF